MNVLRTQAKRPAAFSPSTAHERRELSLTVFTMSDENQKEGTPDETPATEAPSTEEVASSEPAAEEATA